MERTYFINLILWLCLPITRVINRINWRFGRPYQCRAEHVKPLKGTLKPGMVVLTHRNYECSSLFIPGYWTHAAMVLSPGLIIDATRKGVRKNPLDTFFSSVDDFIVLKPGFCRFDVMKKASYKVLKQVGFPFSYDFRNSGNAFYCSGLICSAYAQTLLEKNTCVIPNFFRDFMDGNIIKPEDFYKRKDLWQVLKSYSMPMKRQTAEIDDRLN